MSADGNRIIIGSPLNDDNGNRAGHTQIFEWNGTTWKQLGDNINGENEDDNSGESVAMSANGNRIIIGSPGNGFDVFSGRVRVFELTEPAPAPVTCSGLAVTVDLGSGDTPTEGDDVIRGTAGNDTIDALGGNDIICALGGDDTINSGDGDDTVFAAAGDDLINAGAGKDNISGGPGNDTINGGDDNDIIRGGPGVDLLNGDTGRDRISGGDGNDTISGGDQGDNLRGNVGRDTINGNAGLDIIRGGAWRDTMNGGAGTDGCTLTDPAGIIETRISCETGVFGR